MNKPNPAKSDADGLHKGQPVRNAGAPIQSAKAAVVLLHGRGATVDSMLSLVDDLAQPETIYAAPQAHGQTWYPNSFLAPLEENDPHLSSALHAVSEVLAAHEEGGIPPEKTILLGFSQGACLALEYVARHPRRYGGVVALSGGLLGSGEKDGEPPENKTFDYDGSLDGTPIFIGCSDRDPYVPLRRIDQTVEAMEQHGGTVTKRIYEGMGHTINTDDIGFARRLLGRLR